MMYGNVGKVKTFNKLGIQACINGNFKKGLKYFNTALEYDKNSIMSLYNKAGCLNSLGLDNKADSLFKKVIKLCDDAEKSEFLLTIKANSYIYLNEIEKARKVFSEILKIYPNNINALINEAKFLISDGEYSEALEKIDKILSIDSENFDALMHKGEVLIHFKKYDEAIKYIDQAVTIKPSSSYIWYLKGLYEFEANFNYDLSLKYYDDALRFEESIVYYLGKAKVLSKLGRNDELTELISKILEMHSQNKYGDECLEVISTFK